MNFRVLKKATLGLALSLSFSCSNVLNTSDLSKVNDSESKNSFAIKAVTPPSVKPSCPPPPPPPPIPAPVLAKIKAENPSLLAVLDSLKTMSFPDAHAKMVELSKTYPQYFKAPPPLPPAGTCPPPPKK